MLYLSGRGGRTIFIENQIDNFVLSEHCTADYLYQCRTRKLPTCTSLTLSLPEITMHAHQRDRATGQRSCTHVRHQPAVIPGIEDRNQVLA